MRYGYVRVSSKNQNINRQIDIMEKYNIEKRNIFIDVASGKNFNRPKYIQLIKILKENDTLIIQSIDRLGRNYDEILQQWRLLTKEKKINIIVIDMPLLSSFENNHDLTNIFIVDIVLQLLSYVAELERKKIKERQKEGIISAKKRGVTFGRPPLEIPKDFNIYFNKIINGEISKKEVAAALNISYPTLLKWIKYNKNQKKE
ncbi:recombinase family protein [Anaerofustis butyriciformans]|uniref:recombinase family protein n=1 Tax=Anaerofustis butyriciformans TaxID=3108533 RepID=UPI002E2F9CDD|nr:recombinase family protein [Anaerofustis sp. HA2171]